MRLPHQHRADRLIAAAQALGDGHQVGGNAFLLEGVQAAGAAHAAHHFVGDEQDAVTVADVANAAEIPGHRRQRARGGAAHRLRAEGDDAVRTQPGDGLFELTRQPLAVGSRRLAFGAIAVLVARRDVRDIDQQRRELWRRHSLPPTASAPSVLP